MSHLVFYRKYRPGKFADLFGQKPCRQVLENSITRGDFAHAYLFSGPRGVGKTTVARLLAKAFNCESRKVGEHEPCGVCSSCQEINQGRAIDVIEIDAASNRGIDEIRELKNKARVAPLKLKYKVFIIDEVHMLTREAFDALLKVLEEPPEKTIFLLATTEFQKLPKTIISRCQYFELTRLAFEDLLAYLRMITVKEKIKIEEPVLEFITALAGGYAREATTLLEQVAEMPEINLPAVKMLLGIPEEEMVFSFLKLVFEKRLGEAFKTLQEASSRGEDLTKFSSLAVKILRKVLLYREQNVLTYSYDFNLSPDSLKIVARFAAVFEPDKVLALLKKILENEKNFIETDLSELPLELAVIEVFGGEKLMYDKDSAESVEKVKVSEDKIGSPVEAKSAEEKTPFQNYPPNKPKDISITEIKARWTQFLDELKFYNFSLAGLLKTACLFGVEDDKVILVCDYDFHRERIKDNKNRLLIEDVLEKFFKRKFCLSCLTLKELSIEEKEKLAALKKEAFTVEKQAANQTYAEALEVFGDAAK